MKEETPAATHNLQDRGEFNVEPKEMRRKEEPGKKGRAFAQGMAGMIKDEWGCVGEEERGVYSKKPISRNAKPSSDAPQTKQTKHPIRVIVRDIPQLPMRAGCVVTKLIPKSPKRKQPCHTGRQSSILSFIQKHSAPTC